MSKKKFFIAAAILLCTVILAAGICYLPEYFKHRLETEPGEILTEPDIPAVTDAPDVADVNNQTSESEAPPQASIQEKPEQEALPKNNPEQPPEPEITAEPVEYVLSFAGDCTLGGEGDRGSFIKFVKEDYDWPFKNVLSYFGNDDMTFVNLESVLSMDGKKETKQYNFHAPSEYAQCLIEGSVEMVTLANNHSYDYGKAGYQGTLKTMEEYDVSYVEHEKTAIYTTETGLVIGVYAENFPDSEGRIKSGISELKEQGAEIVICAFHWGTELSYKPTAKQTKLGHAAIDAGANIVYGTHAHVLQPVEQYGDGVIYYSLGNFVFGGNTFPKDNDTVIIQQKVIREADGTVHLGSSRLIPCRLSGNMERNDYQPYPYEEGSKEYLRCMSKLDGTYAKIAGNGKYGEPFPAGPDELWPDDLATEEPVQDENTDTEGVDSENADNNPVENSDAQESVENNDETSGTVTEDARKEEEPNQPEAPAESTNVLP